METEQELPQPLDGEEIKVGICRKVSEAVREALDRRCQLYGKAYPKFKAVITIAIDLDDFGREVVIAAGAEAGDGVVTETAELVKVEIPETPPNVFRRETEQPVPTMVIRDGIQKEQHITYAKKKKRADRD